MYNVQCTSVCMVIFRKKIFRWGETKFLRNDGGQAKIHKIYEVHTLTCSTCTSFSMLESENMTGLALVLICFSIFFFNNLPDEDLENTVTVWARKPRKITAVHNYQYLSLFIAFVFKK